MVGLAFTSSLIFLALIAGGFFFLRLAQGPIDVGLGSRIAAGLEDRVGLGYVFTVGTTSVEQSSTGPSLTIGQFVVKDRGGRTVMAAPRAGISVDPLALAFGQISPKRLEIEDILLRVVRRDDGQIAMTAGVDDAATLSLGGVFESAAEHAPTPSETVVAGGAAQGLLASSSEAEKLAPPPPVGPSANGRTLTRALVALVNDLATSMFDATSPVRALDRFGIERGTLVVDDRPRHASMTYRNFGVEFDREGNDGIFVNAGADGPSGHWSISARVTRTPEGVKLVGLTADHLSIDEIMLAGGMRTLAMDTDMPLSMNVDLAVGADGKLSRADGILSFGAGYFRLDDPDHEPAMVDSFRIPVSVDPASGDISVANADLHAGETSFKVDTKILSPAAPGDPWRMNGSASGIFGAERPGEKPITLSKIIVAVQAYPDLDKVVIDHFAINGPEVAFKADATWQGKPSGNGFLITSTMEAGRMPGSNVMRLWPNWVAAPPRTWLLANLRGGTLDYGRGKFSITDVDLKTMRNQRSVPDDHSHIEFGVSNASLNFMQDVPPLRGLDGTGVITGDTLTFNASKGEMEVTAGHILTLGDGIFSIPSMDPKPSPALITLRVTGQIDTTAELLARDALKPYANLPIDSSSIRGEVDGRLTINLLLGDHVPPDSAKVGVAATVRNFFADKVIGKEPLDGATLSIVADKLGLHAKGDGRMFGAPASIDLKKPAGGAPSEATITVTLDDAARAKAGFNLGKSVTGPISAKITTSLTGGEKSKAALDVDFTKAAFDGPLPGLKKAAGRPAKATCTVTQGGDRVTLDQIAFDSGSTSIRGSAQLDANGGFQGAKLSQLRLSAGDDMKVDAEQGSDGLKLVVRGSNIDGRPFLKEFMSGDGPAKGDSPGKDIDLELHTNLLTGQNGQALSNADLRLSRKGGQFRRVQMTARLGRGLATINTNGQGQSATIVVATKDAGATLSFLDLYKRMDGGRLDATFRFSEGRLDGYTAIHDFTIKEDPAIKKLAEEEIPSDRRNAGARITSSAVPFTKLEAYLSRSGNKVEIRQGSMYGPQMGATVEGSIDFAHDRVALNGTFVPVYGLNNLFSQIPVLGVLLGGGAHEGLFAVNYRIDGSAAAPVMSFDPLSALAPGILRKIFGAIDSAAQQQGGPADTAQTGTTAQVPSDRAAGPGGGGIALPE